MSSNYRRSGKPSRSFSSEKRRTKNKASNNSSPWQKSIKNDTKSKDPKIKHSNQTKSSKERNSQENKMEITSGEKTQSLSNRGKFNTRRELNRSNKLEENLEKTSSNKIQNEFPLRRRFSSNVDNNQETFSEDNHTFDSSRDKDSFQKEPHDIFWGRHSTQSILESGRPIHRIWCTSEIRSSPRFLSLIKDAKSLGALVEEVSWSRLAHVTNGGVHQGIALQAAVTETFDLSSLIEGCNSLDEYPVLIALDGITDPHNLGAIVRSAEALGAHGMILPQRRTAGLTGSVAKAAVGALEHLPVARVINLNRSLEQLKESGYTVIGLAGEGDKTLNEIKFDSPLVLVIGSEGKGLSLLTRRHCDVLVRIPLRGVTSSLNASVATSLFMYEVARRGWMKDLSGQAPSPKIVRARLVNRISGKNNS